MTHRLAERRASGAPARSRPRPASVLLALGMLVVVACGVDRGPSAVTLAALAAGQERFDGAVVVTEGVVRTFDDPRHYWIEDDDVNRVQVVPDTAVEGLVGRRVRVEGRFTFRDDEGRRIAVDAVEVLDTPP